jgi:hypothetical protein
MLLLSMGFESKGLDGIQRRDNVLKAHYTIICFLKKMMKSQIKHIGKNYTAFQLNCRQPVLELSRLPVLYRRAE